MTWECACVRSWSVTSSASVIITGPSSCAGPQQALLLCPHNIHDFYESVMHRPSRPDTYWYLPVRCTCTYIASNRYTHLLLVRHKFCMILTSHVISSLCSRMTCFKPCSRMSARGITARLVAQRRLHGRHAVGKLRRHIRAQRDRDAVQQVLAQRALLRVERRDQQRPAPATGASSEILAGRSSWFAFSDCNETAASHTPSHADSTYHTAGVLLISDANEL